MASELISEDGAKLDNLSLSPRAHIMEGKN